MEQIGTQINTFGETYIYREFSTDKKSLFIMAYNKLTSKFYQKVLTNLEWPHIVNNFSLEELEAIFRVCYEKQPGYDLQINLTENSLSLDFTCKEKIKTYQWTIELLEKNLADMEEISDIFESVKPIVSNILMNNSQKISDTDSFESSFTPDAIATNTMVNQLIEIMNGIEAQVKELFVRQKKELALVSHITKDTIVSQKDNNDDKPDLIKVSLDDLVTDAFKNSTRKTGTKSSSKTTKTTKTTRPAKSAKSGKSVKSVRSSKSKKNISSEEADNSEDYSDTNEEEMDTDDYDNASDDNTDNEEGASDDSVIDSDENAGYSISGYIEMDDVMDIPINSTVKYCSKDRKGFADTEITGILRKISSSGKFVTLQGKNDNVMWKVDVKNKIFFMKYDKKSNKKSDRR